MLTESRIGSLNWTSPGSTLDRPTISRDSGIPNPFNCGETAGDSPVHLSSPRAFEHGFDCEIKASCPWNSGTRPNAVRGEQSSGLDQSLSVR